MIKTKIPPWGSEAAMLCCFRDMLRDWGAKCYGECAGHDMLVVVTDEFMERCDIRGARGMVRDGLEPGDTIAVEGKLRATFKVLDQAMPPDQPGPWGTPGWGRSVGADFYVVVVPDYPEGFVNVALACGVGVAALIPAHERFAGYSGGAVAVPPRIERWAMGRRVVGMERPKLPLLDVEVTPGLPSPMPLTGWKIGAVSLCILAQTRPLTREDFKAAGVDARRFVDSGWLACEGRGPAARWTLTSPAPGNRPDLWYEDIAAAVRARDAAASGIVGALFGSGAS